MFETFAERFPVLVLWAFGWMLPASVLALVFVHLGRHGYLRPFADLFHAARRLSLVGWLCVAPLVVGLVGYASTKNDGGSTNDAPTHMSVPRRMLRSRTEGWLIPSTLVTPDEIAAGYRAPADGAAGIVPAPEGAVTNARWRLRGAHVDAFRPELVDWRFPYRDGMLTGVTVLARGEVRPDVGTLYFPVSPVDGVSLLPEARWNLLSRAPGTGAPPNRGEFPAGAEDSQDASPALGGASVPDARASLFWHALSPSNSLLLTWENALVGRDPNCPTNLQAELYADGRFAWRTDGGSRLYLPVLEFDWDGDGLENSVDPDPLVAGPDAHGTNAEWYRVVCTNVFTEATGSAPEDTDVPRLLPEGVEYRENVTSNAYYFVDVVAEQGPAPIYFTGDQAGFIGAPVVVARAGELNRVPLQIGVEYAVTSAVPFSLTFPVGGFAELRRNDPCEKTVKWPISFTVTTEDDGHTVVVTPYPSDPGGTYHWRRPGEDDEQDGPRARNAVPGAGCSYNAAGGRVTFDCGHGSCTCLGCWLAGDLVSDGVKCDLPTVWCGCTDSHGEEDDDPPPTTPHQDMASAPSVSATFDYPVVFFEDVYTNAPGITFPRQSKTVRLRISAYGGPNGARLNLSKVNVDECLTKIGGHNFPTKEVKIPACSDVNYEFVYQGKAPSKGDRDIKVTASLTAINAMSPKPETAELTAVQVAIEAEDQHPIPELLNRHAFGMREKVYLKTRPESADVTWYSEIANRNGGFLDNAGKFLRCPWTTGVYSVGVESGGAEFETSVSVHQPTVVCRSAMWRTEIPEVNGVAGYVGMSLALYLQPDTVSFSNILMEEIPVLAPDAIPPTGYFALMPGVVYATHDWAAGAGELRTPCFRNGGVYWTDDMAQCPRECPPLPGTIPPAWMNGVMRWNIPVGWGWLEGRRFRLEGQITPQPTEQVYEIDGDGTLSIHKYNHTIMRDVGGRIWLDGSRVNAWWSGWL